MDLLHELVEDTPVNVELFEAITEAVRSMSPNFRQSGKTQTAQNWMKANRGLVVGAAVAAMTANAAYKRNKRNTISLHAKDAYEKKMMTSVVDALTASSKFKLHRSKYEDGGRTWILKRI